MSKLETILCAVSDGLERQAKESPDYPSLNLPNPDFDFQLRRNQICAAGWLLFLFGVAPRKRLGRVVLKSLPHLELARVPRWRLPQALDDAVAALTKAHTEEVNTAIVGPGRIAKRVRNLIDLGAIRSARELFEQNTTDLGDRFEPLQRRLTKLESGHPVPECGHWLAGHRQAASTGTHKPAASSEADQRIANQEIVDFVCGKETASTAEIDTLLADIAAIPKRALSLIDFLHNGLDASFKPKLIAAALRLAPMARFVMFSHWHWVDENLLADALQEALSRGQTYFVEASLLRAMSGRLAPPQNKPEKKKLFDDLYLLAKGRAAFGQDPLTELAKSQGVRVVEPEPSSNTFAADQDYKTTSNGTAHGIASVLTRRAKAWLQSGAEKTNGTIVFSPHAQNLAFASRRLQVALAQTGKPVQTIVSVAPEVGDPAEASDFLTAVRNEGYDITLSGRWLTRRNSYSGRYLDFLRSGAVLQVYFDGQRAPGRRFFVPWLLRPAKLPGFPAQLAISSGADICFAATWIDQDGAPVIDIIPLVAPPRAGSNLVRTLWLTQQFARACRSFAMAQNMPVRRQLIAEYGGPMPKRKLINLETWMQSETVRQSKLCWLADHDPDRIAIRTASESVSYGCLASLCLRMSQMLLHFQDTAPRHTAPDRKFEDQHRVLCLLPASPAAIVTQLASTASGSLLCMGLPEDSDEQLAERIDAFDPDLIVVTCSRWSRLIASHPELESRNALIIGEACDQADLHFLLESFAEAPALPPLDLKCPAYVVYTSGSSGKPKGVVLAAGMASRMRVFNYDAPQTLLTVVRWDTATALETLPAFVGSHTIILPPANGFTNLKQLCDLMIATSTTALSAPCSVLHGMLQNPDFSPELLPKLTVFYPWGEPSRARLIQDLVRRFPKAEINATYGASEFIEVSHGTLAAEDFTNYQGSPGGMLLPGAKAVNSEGRELQVGEIGRVKAMGYDRTLGDFKSLQSGDRVCDPLEDAILLDDWVTILSDGSLDVLGRVDDIVNIRGRRLSMTGVSETAETVEGVGRVFAAAITVRDADAVAIAVETKRKDAGILEIELRQAITKRFFSAAAPVRSLYLEELPRLPSGKLDRKRLKAALESGCSDAFGLMVSTSRGAATSEKSLTPMLELLRDFANHEGLIPRARFDPDSTHPFLDSILSLILMLSIEDRLGTLPPSTVFDRQEPATWRELSEELCACLPQK